MRFFRIPNFTGIEAHRDDADRGSLRVAEGCLPHGPGGVRSGPVWKNVGSVDLFSQNSENHLTAADDDKGNSALFVSKNSEVHDVAIMSTENTALVSLGSTYQVIDPVSIYSAGKAIMSSVGNRLYSFGDGDGEAVFMGKGSPLGNSLIQPDQQLYAQEWARFPNCKFFVQGPRKTIFAAGNPSKPLTVYVSEPAGMTKPERDSIYSEEMSSVDIIGSDASRITALSTRGNQVVVHTDKGCHILFAPSLDQASTGYRVEQAPATNFSAAVNHQVCAGEQGSQQYWLGHDGQIYKDESATRGEEDTKTSGDRTQASYKSKGVWEKEQLTDLRNSFSAFDPQTGMYWVYTENQIQP